METQEKKNYSVLAVVGSKSFMDYELLSQKLQTISFKTIISGGARGADTLAERYAEEHQIPIEVIKPQWKQLGKMAGYIRNEEIISKCDFCIAFWDGESRGTKHMIGIMKEENKLVRVVKYNETTCEEK